MEHDDARSPELFKTPFSRAYWSRAAQDAKKLRTLVFSALMVAACVALGYLRSVPVVNNITVSWGFLARALCALVGGPVNALLFGVVEDTVGYFMSPGGPQGGYNPFYILTTVLGVFTYALFFYRAEVTVLRIFLAKLATNLQNVFLGGLGTYLWYSGGKGYWAIAAGSAVKNAIMLPVQAAMLAALFAALLPALHQMGLLPDQAARLRLWKKPGWLERRKTREQEESAPRGDPWEE